MLNKVYVSDSIDDGLFESRQDFPHAELVYCSELSFEEFCLAHQYTLFDTVVRTFVGVNKYSVEQLLNLVNSEIEIQSCWITKSLDKRTKLYKALKSCSNIEECVPLDSKKSKSAFIRKWLRQLKISSDLFDKIVETLPDDKAIIFRELTKLKTALQILPEDMALRSLTITKADSQTMEFISELFSGSEAKSARLAHRISHIPVPVMSSTLSSRLLSFIFLSINKQDYAKNFWDRNGYYIQQDVKTAKRIGYKSLLAIYSYVDATYGNLFRRDSEQLRLLKLIRYVNTI